MTNQGDLSTDPIRATSPHAERMHCMEVWGGNQEVERHFEMAGLEVWIYSRPYLQADSGGDVYYISSCASGRITRSLLADVSGHGPEVAALADGLRDLMRRNINFIKQKRFVGAMNEQFGELAKHGGFATAIVSTFFAPTRSLSLSHAGHPDPLILRAGTDEWARMTPHEPSTGSIANTPFGVVNEAHYPQSEAKLDPGDLFLCYSDSLSEASDQQGKQIGVEGLKEVLDELIDVPPSLLIRRLLTALQEKNAENLNDDDTTVLLFRATGGQPGWRDNLMAPLRLLRPVNDATQFRGNATEGNGTPTPSRDSLR